jgi:hypothetical protein
MSTSKINKPSKTTAFFICVCVASFLWLIHNLNRTYDYTVQIPVQFINQPILKLATQPLPEKLNVNLKLSGLKILFYKLKNKIETITIDFNALKSDAKKNNYSISSYQTSLKESLLFRPDILQVIPDSIVLIEKRGISKNVPIKTIINAKATKGYCITQLITSPAFITIYGDSTSIKTMDTVYTEALSLTALQNSYSSNVSLLNPSPNLVFNSTTAHLTIKVEKLVDHSLMVPVQITNLPDGYVGKCFPAQVKLNYTAPLSETISAQSISLSTNSKKRQSNTQKAPVEILVKPSDLHVLSIEPEEVELIIIKK